MLNIKKIRIELNMTQRTMALLIGVPLTTYKSWEQGRCLPNFQNNEKIHKALIDLGKLETAEKFKTDYIDTKSSIAVKQNKNYSDSNENHNDSNMRIIY